MLSNSRQASRLLRSCHKVQRIQCATKFWERDRRAGYDTQPPELPLVDQLKTGAKLWKPELQKFAQECKEKMLCDNIFDLQDGDYEIVWKFDNSESLKDWTVTADSDFGEGKTKAQLIFGKNKNGVFEGCLNTDVQKDGQIKRAGYATMKSPLHFVSILINQ